MDLVIQHNKEDKQFFAITENRKSKLDYKILSNGKTLDLYSTFVPPELRGKKIGQNIVKYALDYALNNHYKVVPSCPFVKKYIDNHPEYQKLLTG